jgi:hypothetical protein
MAGNIVGSEINAKLNAFVDMFLYFFDVVFQLKLINRGEPQRRS